MEEKQDSRNNRRGKRKKDPLHPTITTELLDRHTDQAHTHRHTIPPEIAFPELNIRCTGKVGTYTFRSMIPILECSALNP